MFAINCLDKGTCENPIVI